MATLDFDRFESPVRMGVQLEEVFVDARDGVVLKKPRSMRRAVVVKSLFNGMRAAIAQVDSDFLWGALMSLEREGDLDLTDLGDPLSLIVDKVAQAILAEVKLGSVQIIDVDEAPVLAESWQDDGGRRVQTLSRMEVSNISPMIRSMIEKALVKNRAAVGAVNNLTAELTEDGLA